MELDFIQTIITAIVTGGVSTLGTVKALRVHITYINKRLDTQEKAITRAHKRIDGIVEH